jgi:hypothetical protein
LIASHSVVHGGMTPLVHARWFAVATGQAVGIIQQSPVGLPTTLHCAIVPALRSQTARAGHFSMPPAVHFVPTASLHTPDEATETPLAAARVSFQ